MAKFEYILTEKRKDSSTQRGPRVKAASSSLATVRDEEIPSSAKEPEFHGTQYYMIQRLEDLVTVDEGPIKPPV